MKVRKFAILSLIAIIIIGLVFIYIKTDFLKTNEQLFWKYMCKEVENIGNVFANDDIKKYNENLENGSYTKEIQISLSGKFNIIKPIELHISKTGNCSEKIDYFELFSIDKEFKNHLIFEYLPVARKYIKSYSKKTNNQSSNSKKINEYTLSVSQKQAKDLALEILKKAKNDDQMLSFISNKAKIINNSNRYCDKQNVKMQIEEWLDKIEKIEANDSELVSITIYKQQNEVNKMLITVNEKRKIEVFVGNNEITLTQNFNSNSSNEIQLGSLKEIGYTVLNSISKITYSRNIENGDTIKEEFQAICTIGLEQIVLNISSKESITSN